MVSLLPKYVHLESRTITLFGNRVFADVINLKTLRWDYPGLSEYPILFLNKKARGKVERLKGEGRGRRRQGLESCSHQPTGADSHRKLKEERDRLCPGVSGGSADPSPPGLQVDERQYISVVLSHQICGNLWWQP